MKLVFYSPRFYPLIGGLEKVVRVWAEVLALQPIDITILTETAGNGPDHFPFKVYRNASLGRQLHVMRQADAIIQFNVSLKGLPAVLLSGRPLIITHHTALFFPNGKMPWRQQFKRWVSDHLAIANISCSHYMAKQFRSSAVVHSPYEAELFVNQGSRRSASSVVYVGRLVSDKGVDVLLIAFARLAANYPACRLSIVGDGPDKQTLESLAAELGIADRVSFKGSMSGKFLVDFLNQQEIMVVPSRMEPFGTTVLEGLACGCRMIVSNQGGLPEAAGGLARIFESGDVASLTKALEAEMEHPTVLDQAALQAHLAAHTVTHTAEEFLENIQQCLRP